jgi:hypothetical protein
MKRCLLRAVPSSGEQSRTEPSCEQVAHRVAWPHFVVARQRYKHLDDARVGKGHVTTSAVTQHLKRSPACQMRGFIGVRSSSSQELVHNQIMQETGRSYPKS